jgi:L,D-peptidoglycan transpeptidase YkuD (ErfK/YbiS/YcfS/YnhG family)
MAVKWSGHRGSGDTRTSLPAFDAAASWPATEGRILVPLPRSVRARRWSTPLVALALLTAGLVTWPSAVRPTPAAAASTSVATAVALTSLPGGGGYWITSSTGGVYAFGDATSYGSMSGHTLNAPIVGMAATPDGKGYWLVAADGGVFSYGDAGFWGSAGALALNAPIVGMAATPSGDGYWLVASDGGVFSYGDATFWGSAGSLRLNAPVVGLAATPSGHGYWLVGSDGGVFSYGDATFRGSAGSLPLNRAVVGMEATATGAGYWLVAADGGIFNYGDAPFWGSTGSLRLDQPIVGMADDPGAAGYWLVAGDGGVFALGTAPFEGSATADINPPLVDQLAGTGGGRQVITVDAPSASSTTATLTSWENDGSGWYEALPPMPAVNGANGWLPAPSRIEGDNTTPDGIYPIGSTMYGTEPDPGTQFPYHQLVCGDWWDEDSNSPTYNTFEHVPCGTTPPFAAASEALWTEGNAYPYMAVIDFNTPPTGPYGSGIFLHADVGQPTAGCVSLPLSDLVQVLDWLKPALNPVIVMGPDSVIRSF